MANPACQSCLSIEDLVNIADSNFNHNENLVPFIQCYKFCTNQSLVDDQAKICQVCFKQYKNLYIFRNKMQKKPEIDIKQIEDSLIKSEPMDTTEVLSDSVFETVFKVEFDDMFAG
jgi:hypothetical protein